jgi:SAM-dependent methyltransferase
MVSRAAGEYARRGEYHKALDPAWSYAPIYRRKMRLVRDLLTSLPPAARILDAGCGEGVLVEEYRGRGARIFGVDRDFASRAVLPGDLLALPFGSAAFDLVLLLDVIEHFPFDRQRALLREVRRVLREGGTLVVSAPNLAHLGSRWKFLWTGKLGRTGSLEYHPGDRPVHEYLEMLPPAGFRLIRRRGIFPTVPGLYQVVRRHPARFGWLVGLVDWAALPGWCFLNILECRAV